MPEKIVSFRSKLVAYGLFIVSVVALPVIYVEAQRPWDEMYSLLAKTEILLKTVVASTDQQEIQVMNNFTFQIIMELHEDVDATNNDTEPENSYSNWVKSHAFELVLLANGMPPEADVLALFKKENIRLSGFNYEELKKWYRFWQLKFKEHPGTLEIFRKYKAILRQVGERDAKSGFQVADVYLTLDKGKAGKGYFKDNLALVLESTPWWKGSYPGKPYNLVESKTAYWRASYDVASGGKTGFAHNPVASAADWYLPHVDTDEWGVWFSGWVSSLQRDENGEHFYSILNADFDASVVKQMMAKTASAIVFFAVILFVVIIFIARIISQHLIRPIEGLTDGAEAVMSGDYNYQIKNTSNDEFRNLIEVFNRMIVWIRERVNLKDTLTKFLSEDLAEKAAQNGLVLGGQQVDCTIMFTDFSGFSTLTQKISATEAVELLNFYFSELIPIIKKWGGFPDKFIGDAIVAMFGAPVRFDAHAEHAVRCAVEMQKKLRELNEKRREAGEIVFEMRVGLNSGDVIVGAIGCDLKMEYTSIGETTNLANRMEAKCKVGHVLMAENTYKKLPQDLIAEFKIDKTPNMETVKGYAQPISTYGIYVHNLIITAGNSTENLLHFYNYEIVKRETAHAAIDS